MAPPPTQLAGPRPGPRDIISGNGRSGVYLSGAGTSNNVVAGDYIGTDQFGETALGNGYGGVIAGGASSNTIGGSTAVPRTLSRATRRAAYFYLTRGRSITWFPAITSARTHPGRWPLATTRTAWTLSAALRPTRSAERRPVPAM